MHDCFTSFGGFWDDPSLVPMLLCFLVPNLCLLGVYLRVYGRGAFENEGVGDILISRRKKKLKEGFQWLPKWFEEIKEWKSNLENRERFVGLSVEGIPLDAWNVINFQKFGARFGEFITVRNIFYGLSISLDYFPDGIM